MHASRKQKYARGNHMPFMKRALSKKSEELKKQK